MQDDIFSIDAGNTGEATEKAILVGLNSPVLTSEENATEDSLDELEALLETAGGEAVGRVLQNRNSPEPRTFIGEGKVREVAGMAKELGAELVVFDNELSPSQLRALEELTGVRVMDRSALILDIFAKRAKTREGRLQVELAQYKYLLPRLTRMWSHLASQTASGGKSPIGTRGPGETQLETDRRHIRRKITALEAELKEVRRVRGIQRVRRTKNEVPVIAIVGYTNAGKSTLLNSLTDADIPANDRLFDTLDTTTRQVRLGSSEQALISDTVGFISKLPHHLVEAFKATLEELTFADILLHVIDLSNPEWEAQAEVVDRLITQLGAGDKPRIEVYNKIDMIGDAEIVPRGEGKVCVSAKNSQGLERLLDEIVTALDTGRKQVRLLLPYDKAGMVESLYMETDVVSVDYTEVGVYVTTVLNGKQFGHLNRYIVVE